MSITTKTGDSGETGLLFSKRIIVIPKVYYSLRES